jgi:CubicO group peptidase (beta-lactamase class C family)
MKRTARRIGLFVALAILLPCLVDEALAASCGPAADAGGEFETASLEQAKLDPAILCTLNEKLDARPEANVHAVVVLRDGRLVFETYRKGSDQTWGTGLGDVSYTPSMIHDTRSVSKSVVSLLVGVAIDRKLIGSVDERVFSYFPEYEAIRTPEKDTITLQHVLTMSAGLRANEDAEWNSPYNTEREMYQSVDPYRTVLNQKQWNKPGEQWAYNSGCTMLLAAVLQKVTGKRWTDFAKEALFDPLGIKEFEWITVEPSDEPAAGGGLRLRPRDMAKIGQLVLNKGEWNGRSVVSAGWIEGSLEPRHEAGGGLSYGYQWWLGASDIGGKSYDWIAAWGLGGQRIFIVPELNLVVAITAGMYMSPRQEFVARAVLEEFVLASVLD